MADLEKKPAQEATPVAKDEKKVKPKKEKAPLKDRIVKFFRDYKSEFKKIVWFGRKQTVSYTILTIASILIIGAIIALLDFGFGKAILALGGL